MATGFKYRSYTTDTGLVVRIRMSEQVANFTGQGATTQTIEDDHIYAFASNPGSRRKKQLNARGVMLGRDVGTSPNIFRRKTFVPITTEGALAALSVGTAVAAYGGQAWTIDQKISEA